MPPTLRRVDDALFRNKRYFGDAILVHSFLRHTLVYVRASVDSTLQIPYCHITLFIVTFDLKRHNPMGVRRE